MRLLTDPFAVNMAFPLFVAVPLAFAHETVAGTGPDQHVDSHGHQHASHDVASDAESPLTYFAHQEHIALLYSHIALMVLSWVFILPIAVMLSLARSRFLLLSQLIFTVTNASGVILASIYNSRTPDLYPNNAHHKVGWIATLVTAGQVLFSLLVRCARRTRTQNHDSFIESRALLTSPLSTSTHHGSSIVNIGNGSERVSNADYQRTSSSSSTVLGEEDDYTDSSLKNLHDFEEDFGHESPGLSHRSSIRRKSLMSKIIVYLPRQIISYNNILYRVIDRIILPFGFIVIMTGIATLGRFFESKAIYGGLAHWIKGGVFFWLGSLTLGRWSGSFGELGWAWNVVPRTRLTRRRISAEFAESALIFFYGATNVFLEHLGNWGGSWSAQDYEHLAITILFIGGGACGMLVESTQVRDLLNLPTLNVMLEERRSDEEDKRSSVPPETYQFSQNPIPALVILLLGAMMSSHHQSTATSTMVHKQWGQLLTGAALSRAVTYVLIYLRPPITSLPSRPPTELLTSFGLMAGGLVFMSSAADIVDGMIRYELDAMFIYTITLGVVGLIMAWELVVMAVKGLATRHELRAVRGSRRVTVRGDDAVEESCIL